MHSSAEASRNSETDAEGFVLEPVIPADHPRRTDLSALRRELERHWSVDTSFSPDKWTPNRPSVGQCAVTSMIVHDRFGGEMLRSVNEGVMHYWNRIDGVDVDLTRDQFDTWAPTQEIAIVDREDVSASGPTLADRHRRLAAALEARLRFQ